MDSNGQASSEPTNDGRDEIQRELSHILKRIQHDVTLQGVLSIGRDGVLRSLTADRKVVDTVGLRPELIKAMFDRMPFNAQNEIDYRGVDGTKVPENQWYHPDKSQLPPPLPEEKVQKSFTEEELERSRELLRRMAERYCPLRLLSDHDLGLKKSTPSSPNPKQS